MLLCVIIGDLPKSFIKEKVNNNQYVGLLLDLLR